VLLQDLQIAQTTSRWPITWPMALTVLRLLLLPIFLWLLWPGTDFPGLADDQRRHLAVFILLLMCVTDILDGYLARRLQQTSRLGTLLDPTADKLLVETSLLLLCIGSRSLGGFSIPWPVVLGAYLKDLGVLIGIAVVIKRNGTVKLTSQVAGKISTAAQLTLVMATLLAADIARWSPGIAGGLIWALWWATVWATAASGWEYSYQGSRQLRPQPATAV
jgi:cardiolipin synthase (CMP-forming)